MAYTYPFSTADEKLKKSVWAKGGTIQGYDSSVWRYDKCGHTIKYEEHGNTNSSYGWEIDHAFPKAKGGSDEISNLQPLYWKNNRDKGDTYPWTCP